MLKKEAFLTIVIAVVIIFIVSAYALRSNNVVQRGAADQLQQLAQSGKIAVAPDGTAVNQVAPLTNGELQLVTQVQQKLGQNSNATTDTPTNVVNQLVDMLKPNLEEVSPQLAETVLDRLVSEGKVNMNSEAEQVQKIGELTEAEEKVVDVFNQKIDDITGKTNLPPSQNPGNANSAVDQLSLQQIATTLADMKRKVLVEVDPKRRDIRLVLSKQQLTPFQQRVIERAQAIIKANREIESQQKALEAATQQAEAATCQNNTNQIDQLADRVTGRILQAVEEQQILQQQQQQQQQQEQQNRQKLSGQCGHATNNNEDEDAEDCTRSWYRAAAKLASC